MNRTIEPGDVLTDERIAAMRAEVMGQLEAEESGAVSTKQSRRRLSPALIAAAAVVTAGSIGVGIIETRSSGQSESGLVAQTSSDGGVFDGNFGARESAMVEAAPGDASGEANTQVAPGDEDAREVITTGHVMLIVPVVSEAVATIEQIVDGLDGWIDSRSVSGDGESSGVAIDQRAPDRSRGWGSVVVRVYPENVGTFTEELRELGVVESMSINKSDVTGVTTDLDARIRSLQVSVTRLTEIMGEADTATELLAAETQLSQRQAELESLQAQRRTFSGQVEMASITVELQPESKVTEIEPGGFMGGLERGWDALVSTANAGLVGFGILLPWLIPLAVVAFVARLIWRRRTPVGS